MSTLEETVAELLSAVGVDPMLRITTGADGQPVAATAIARVDASPAEIWTVLVDVDRYADRIPLIERVRVRGSAIDFGLRFRVALLSVNFSFQSSLSVVEGRSLLLSYRGGEPRDIEIEFLIRPLPEVQQATALAVRIGFDVMSVGWLARFFLKHHPEIQYGVHAGCALALLDSMRKAAEPARGRPSINGR